MRTPASYSSPRSGFLRQYSFSIATCTIALLSLFTDWYAALSICLFSITVLIMIDRLGKGIVLREVIALNSLFVCLLMPALGYDYYTINNHLAKLWGRYMPVAEDRYFHFALPAEALFVLAICWPIATKQVSDEGALLQAVLGRCRKVLLQIPNASIYLITTGLVALIGSRFLPGVMQFVGTLVFWSSFAGVLYLYFTPELKRKKLILTGFAILIFLSALESGMFTLVAYMGITIFSFFFLGKKTSFVKKLIVFLIGCAFLLVLQGTKGNYRKYLWGQGYQDDKALLFANLFINQIGHFSEFFTPDAFFPIYYRTNQGYNVSLVMRTIPARKDFDYGANLGVSMASSVVPRLFWPDKPEAGGKFNMKYYTGTILSQGWSTNVGPLGEAYGSFGITGGIIYMFFLGGFIRWAYKRVFVLSVKTPLLIFWLPVIFYQVTYSAETDTLQIMNSVIKSAFFVWILIKITPGWFGVIKKKTRRNLAVKGKEFISPV
jgi:hypothetical protein